MGRNQLVVLKLASGIWQNLTRALKSLKNVILMGSFWAKYILIELKKYREIIFHETEERYKIWRGIDLSFQNWHKEFDKIWPGTPQSLKNFHFNELLLSKVYIVWAKKVQRNNLSWHWRVMQHLNNLACCTWKITWGILQIFPRALASVRIGTLIRSFCQK